MSDASARYNLKMSSILLGPQIGPRALRRLTPPAQPTSYVITDRDERILDGLARFRFMHTAQAAIWAGGSVRGVRTRLYHLWADGLVSRPPQQAIHMQNFFHNGAIPLVYELGRKATKYLSDRGVPLAHRLDWSFREGAAPELSHALATTDFMVALHRAVAAENAVCIVDHAELLSSFPDATQRSRRPFRIWANVTDRDGTTTSRGTIPDRLFSLHFDNQRVNLALEIDMATETLDPKKLGSKGTIRSKHAVYHAAFEQDRYAAVWNFERLRVLTVAPSETRVVNMIKTQHVTTKGHATGLFLYSTPQRLAEYGVLGPAWKTAAEDGVSLLPTELARS